VRESEGPGEEELEKGKTEKGEGKKTAAISASWTETNDGLIQGGARRKKEGKDLKPSGSKIEEKDSARLERGVRFD